MCLSICRAMVQIPKRPAFVKEENEEMRDMKQERAKRAFNDRLVVHNGCNNGIMMV